MPIPLRSDRSAWDTIGYASLHARDIENGSALVHLPSVGPNQIAVWDGARWTGVPFEASELLDIDMTQVQDGHVLIYDAVSGKWLTGPMDVEAQIEPHAAGHQNGGADEINVDGLSGVLADEQNAGALKGKPVDLTGLADGHVLQYHSATDSFALSEMSGGGGGGPHAASHQDGGADEINVTGLSGLLATPQTPAAHTHPNYVDSEYFSAMLQSHTHDQYAEKASGVTYYVGGSGASNTNIGTYPELPLATLAEAINRLKGRALNYCTIMLRPGTYTGSHTFTGISGSYLDLRVVGDCVGSKANVGRAYTHGASIYWPASDYMGRGVVNIALTRYTSWNETKFTVTCTGTDPRSPNFAADGIDGSNKLLVWEGISGGSWNEYDIVDVTGNTITIDGLLTSTSFANGMGFVITPNVRITSNWGNPLIVQGCNVAFHGIYMDAPATSGMSISVNGFVYIMSSVLFTKYASGIACAVTGARLLAGKDGVTFISDQNQALVVQHGGYAQVDYTAFYGKDTGLYVLYGSDAAASYATFFSAYSPAIGIRALRGGYVVALATSSNNFHSTKFSPATSDTVGNNSASITFS